MGCPHIRPRQWCERWFDMQTSSSYLERTWHRIQWTLKPAILIAASRWLFQWQCSIQNDGSLFKWTWDHISDQIFKIWFSLTLSSMAHINETNASISIPIDFSDRESTVVIVAETIPLEMSQAEMIEELNLRIRRLEICNRDINEVSTPYVYRSTHLVLIFVHRWGIFGRPRQQSWQTMSNLENLRYSACVMRTIIWKWALNTSSMWVRGAYESRCRIWHGSYSDEKLLPGSRQGGGHERPMRGLIINWILWMMIINLHFQYECSISLDIL